MKFLIKIEEAINNLIEKLLEKLKAMVPEFVYKCIAHVMHLPSIIKKILHSLISKITAFCKIYVGYIKEYITIIVGSFISVINYIRSDEFKKKDKKTLFLSLFRYAKTNPFSSVFAVIVVTFLTGATFLIFQNTDKIIRGTYALRAPASGEEAEEDVYIEFKNHKFEAKLPGGGGGGKGVAIVELNKVELYLDVKIEANSPADKDFLEHMEEMLDDNLEALEISIARLPLAADNQKSLEELMVTSLNADFTKIGHPHPIKSIKLKQILAGRPAYYRQGERMMSVTDINLQIFLEDTSRNRQVWLDFTILASNRNAALYLTEHDIQLKDHLMNNVEPIIPQLPIEEEGRMIIKDKVRDELNIFLEKNGIEGKILVVYIDYLMAT